MSTSGHWDAVYDRTGEAGGSWYQDEPAPSLDLLTELDVAPTASIIDVGGGASRLADRLLDRGFADVTVLDVSAEAVRLAKERLGKDAGRVHWVVQDLLAWKPDRQFDVWHDRAVFHFLLRADEQQQYLQLLHSTLPAGGSVVIATFAGDGPEHCSGLPVARYDVDDLEEFLGSRFRVEVGRRLVHRTPSGAEQPFTWVGARALGSVESPASGPDGR